MATKATQSLVLPGPFATVTVIGAPAFTIIGVAVTLMVRLCVCVCTVTGPLVASLVADYFGEPSAVRNFGMVYSAKVFGGLIGIGLPALLVTSHRLMVPFLVAGPLSLCAAAMTRMLHLRPPVTAFKVSAAVVPTYDFHAKRSADPRE